jgi:hypothetical protein
MGPSSGIRAPQGDSGEPPVHNHEHSRGRGSEFDRQLRFAAADPVHRRVELRVSSGLGQRHHPDLQLRTLDDLFTYAEANGITLPPQIKTAC